MGCWSVSCGISNVAITCGNRCVLLPLKENRHHSYGYSSHIAAALPIFGEYNDYGGIENIEKSANTDLIESHFNISIQEFCDFLVDGKFTYDRDEAKGIAKKVSKEALAEIKEWRFMWIDSQVYDFMSKPLDKYHKGYNDYGTPEMLKLLGFEKVEGVAIKNYDPKRFNQVWKKGKVKFFSDGSTLLTGKDRYVYHFGKGDETSIETYFDVPEELNYLKDLHKHETWRLLSKGKAKGKLGGIIGKRDDFGDDSLEDILAAISGVKPKPKTLQAKYLADLESFGDDLAKLVSVYQNLHPMSGEFSPHKLYLTPQCGEHRAHQVLLEKFTEINKSYIQDEED